MSGKRERKHKGRVVRAEIRIAAPARDVYEAWADPERIARWFVDRAEGRAETGSVMTWIFEDFGYRLPVPILEAEAGKRIVTGSASDEDTVGPDGLKRPPALMEVDIIADGGHTIVRLVNSGFLDGEAWDEEYRGVESGWAMALGQLKYWLERHPNDRRTHLLVMRPAAFDFERHAALYHTAAGLSRWLGDAVGAGSEPLAPGARVMARVGGTHPLAGEVLAASGREVLISWPEQHGAIGLKAFSMGPARMVALDCSVWKSGGPDAGLREALDGAVAKLAACVGPNPAT